MDVGCARNKIKERDIRFNTCTLKRKCSWVFSFFISSDDDDDDDDDEEDVKEKEASKKNDKMNPLIVDYESQDAKEERKLDMWFKMVSV